MTNSRLLGMLGLIMLGIVSRLLPHPPNFTSLNAIALLGTACLGSRWLSMATVAATIFFSDLVLGTHSTMPYVYLSFCLVIVVGDYLKHQLFSSKMPLICLATSLLFFVIANFGVWMTSGLYSKTPEGLYLCYLAAIPFFTYQFLGDLFYAVLIKNYFSKNCSLEGLVSQSK